MDGGRAADGRTQRDCARAIRVVRLAGLLGFGGLLVVRSRLFGFGLAGFPSCFDGRKFRRRRIRMVFQFHARRRGLGEASGSPWRFRRRGGLGLPFPRGLGRGIENGGGGAVAMLRSERLTGVITAQLVGLIFVDRAGMGNFFSDTEFVQLVDDLARLYFELPRQLIDSNLTHI
jgi:hypothetical protein